MGQSLTSRERRSRRMVLEQASTWLRISIRRSCRQSSNTANARLVGQKQSPDARLHGHVWWRGDLANYRSTTLLRTPDRFEDEANAPRFSRIRRIRELPVA